MLLELRSLPSQHDQVHEAPLYSPYNHKIPVSLPYDLIRLHQERSFLSMRLADSVTYLKALHERQAKNARQLSAGATLPLKRKKLQQTKRHLDSEIRNRERDEQACLNNLQACETNIILANIKAYHLANASFYAPEPTRTPPLYTPTLCSNTGSEATDLTWEERTDEAVVPSFPKNNNNDPFLVGDVALADCTDGLRRDSAMANDVKRPPPLCQDAVVLSNSLPVPLNTTQPDYRQSSMLSPEAAVFQSIYPFVDQQSDGLKLMSKRLSMLSTTASKAKEFQQSRRSSGAEIAPILQRFFIDAQPSAEHLHGHMWCKSASQQKPQKDAAIPFRRRRAKSL